MRNYNCTSLNEELYHHGIKGMRWGVRRFQNPDGSLTKAGALYVAAPMMASMTVNHIRAEKYRDEHPNTELTDKEIIKMLNEQTARGD